MKIERSLSFYVELNAKLSQKWHQSWENSDENRKFSTNFQINISIVCIATESHHEQKKTLPKTIKKIKLN